MMKDSNDELCQKELENLTIGEQIQELSKKYNKVTEELHQQVRDKHDALLQQATQFGNFDVALNTLSTDVQQIRDTGHRLKSQVDSQYEMIGNQTKVLGRLHKLSHLLRSAGTLAVLTGKLKNTKDVLKQAEIHSELGVLIEDKELQKIDFIQNERSYVISSRQKIKNLTQMQLVTGLKERNETQVVNALKVFMNFNTLEKCLENMITTFISDIEQSLKECFVGNDISVLNSSDNVRSNPVVSKSNAAAMRVPGKTPQLTTSQNYRAKFWKSLHWLIYDELFEMWGQINLLKSSLEKINQLHFVTDVEKAIHINFWKAVMALFRKSFAECASHVSQTLQEGLSKLLSSIRGLEKRTNGTFIFDNEIFASLRTGYVSKTAANMKACLAGVDLPSNETIDNFIRISTTEISAALIDDNLTNSVTAIFVACSKELCVKLESQIKLGTDSTQVVDIPNFQQIQNNLVANILYYYKDSVKRMLNDLQHHFLQTQSETKVREEISMCIANATILISTILQQIIDSIISTISIIILSMHREPGLNTEKISVNGPSMYMKEFQEFLIRVWASHIDPFDDKQLISICGQELAKRCIELFINNISILRPLSNAGRQRIKNDCTYITQVLERISPNLSELGNSTRMLRAVSYLIIKTPQEIITQNLDKDSLIPSYIVLFILFGHGSPELESPHTTVNWSNERLIEWLEGHTSEREKLELISGALQRYRDNVRRKKSDHYDEIYPLIVDFFEKVLKAST